jgi:hypothetical protein
MATRRPTDPAAAAGIARAKARVRARATREARAQARARARRIPRRTPEERLHEFLGRQGPQTKLTVTRIEQLKRAVRAGIPLTLAAESLGVSRQTLYDWKERHPYISDIWARAEAQHAVDALKMITSAAGEGDWRAAAWWLERRRAEEFVKAHKVEANVSGDWAGLVADLDKTPETESQAP